MKIDKGFKKLCPRHTATLLSFYLLLRLFYPSTGIQTYGLITVVMTSLFLLLHKPPCPIYKHAYASNSSNSYPMTSLQASQIVFLSLNTAQDVTYSCNKSLASRLSRKNIYIKIPWTLIQAKFQDLNIIIKSFHLIRWQYIQKVIW